MLRLSSFIVVLLMPLILLAQSPHGTGLKIRCDVCHTQEGWKFNPANNRFDHSKTPFPLNGQHLAVNCRQCHKDLNFSNAKTSCNACHLDVHQQTVGTECQRCHTPESWVVKNITEIHRISRFPLQGQHAQVDCYQCHSSASLLRFDPLGVECKDCHTKTFTTTTNPSHVSAKFPVDCFLCHTDKGWQPAKFDHNTTGFPLKNGHFGVECIKCHTNGYKAVAKECINCHQQDFNSALNPPHQAAKLSAECLKCHTDKSWKPSTFNHNTGTQFPLKGGHVGVDCIKCHSNGYVNTQTACVSCHQANFTASTNPSHVAAKFSTDCIKCHTETAWKPSSYNHNTATNFPLKGGHIGVDCLKCHTTGYAGIASTCISCHQKNYNATINPPHLSGKFSTDCLKCHTESVWKPSTFNHNTATAFPLTNGHAGVDCIKCHSSGYTGTSKECSACHLSDFQATINPSHIKAKFPSDCLLCHTTVAWKPSSFFHSTSTSFPLTGGHIGVECIKCHATGYAGTSRDCYSCHSNNYKATTNPSHTAAKFSTDCATCHNMIAWKPSTFNHNTNTSYPLTGGHVGVDCLKCHTTGYVGTTKICSGCHINTYNATTNPSHIAAKFPTDCPVCHTVTAWKPSTFNHNTSTTFPLTGGHTGVDCLKCNTTGYVGTTKICSGCHINTYNATTNPSHIAAKFPTDCPVCHTVTAWKPSTFNHNTSTTFPLTGGHTGVDCLKCHTTGYVGTTKICSGCHINTYNATTNPSHIAAKFPTDCPVCHTVTAWKPSTFNHNTSTTFPLTGGHVGVDCLKCHSTGYVGTTKLCSGCHLNDYNATTNPGHLAAKFSTDCTKCHNVTAWKPSTFNHTTGTTFPLTGGHIGVDCIKCHANGYAGTTKLCSGCHIPDYNKTTNPAHLAAKFPTNCESCHTMTAWVPSTFNHDSQYFRIYSGKHKSRWTLCTQCHTNVSNYATFSCIDCHEHSKTSMDSAHKGRTGYVYNSTNCFNCHSKI